MAGGGGLQLPRVADVERRYDFLVLILTGGTVRENGQGPLLATALSKSV
jgi:hypothetical protein